MLQTSHNQQPWFIRARLTEDKVRASDKRVRFVTLEAYLAAGGHVLRDLFESDDGGWLEDVALLDRLQTEKFETEVAAIAAERSEEHTSELQSLMRISYAVFCLKKKNTTKKQTIKRHISS